MLSEHVPAVWVEQIVADWRRAVGTTPAVSDEYRAITGDRHGPSASGSWTTPDSSPRRPRTDVVVRR